MFQDAYIIYFFALSAMQGYHVFVDGNYSIFKNNDFKWEIILRSQEAHSHSLKHHCVV